MVAWALSSSAVSLLLFWRSRPRTQAAARETQECGRHIQRFRSPFAVYLKALAVWSACSSLEQRDKRMYVGNTSVSTPKWEYNRLRQVLQDRYVQVEPAIRTWA